MPKPPVTAPIKFQKLIDDISALYIDARKVYAQFAWATGQRIVQVEQDGDVRAAYGKKLISKISKKLTEKFGAGFSETTLGKMRQFYLQYPISPISEKLDWSDYVELLPVKDKDTRHRLESRISKEDLNTQEIRKVIKAIRHVPSSKETKLPALKPPADLRLETFAKSDSRQEIAEDEVLVECGFFIDWPVNQEKIKSLTITATPSYTYAATIDRVIDGDTLLVTVKVGFRIRMHDRLRLRGINCPESKMPAGEKAKRFVARLLPIGSTIILKSHKSKTDQHGRFVVDVFFKPGSNNPTHIIEGGIYLNQHLIDTGHAVRMKE